MRICITIILFSLSGITSSYLYYKYPGHGGVFFPGLLYTSSTLILFVLYKIQLSISRLSLYYLLMNVVYLVAWVLTMMSAWFGFLVGIVTAGFGAIVTFMLTDRYITKISFEKGWIFIWGGAAFLLTDIMYALERTPVEYVFKLEREIVTLFGDVFVFWHLLVGIALCWTMEQARDRNAALQRAGEASPQTWEQNIT